MKIDYSNVVEAFKNVNIKTLEDKAYKARKTLLEKTGLGSEMTGWVNYPNEISDELISDIKKVANDIRSKSTVLVVVGIGGSYLGTKAVVEMLKPYFRQVNDLKIVFAGHTLSSTYMVDLLAYLEDKDFCINYVSKSGTTTEPAVAFRLLRQLLINKYGDSHKDRIYVTTDEFKGNALKMAQENGYKLFYIPSNIGGRYSAFTASTLLPMACGNLDIDSFIEGAKEAVFDCKELSFDNNVALKYAAFRNFNYNKGKKIEILSVFAPRFFSISEWWEQLFGESEGKGGKGLYPTSLVYSTSLHSIGQFIQDGSRVMFETILDVEKCKSDMRFPGLEDNSDNLNYLSNYTLHEINKKMLEATMLAHAKGDTPNIVLKIEKLDTYNLGYLMYTLMFACAISSYILGVNPFDQPGVEEYKNNMYALLGKPGYEELRKGLEDLL